MLYLEATKIARQELGVGRLEFAGPGKTDSLLGNWLVNVVPIGRRYAFLFMSVPSLLTFPIFIGRRTPSPDDMPNFLAHGVEYVLGRLHPPPRQLPALLSDFNEVALCKAANKSLLGIHAGIAGDYFHQVDRGGPNVDIDAVVKNINSAPRAPLDWRTPLEVAHDMLAASEA